MADKYLALLNGQVTQVEGLQSSAGSGSAGKIPALDGAGRLPANMMPAGIGADIGVITASEDLAAGDLVNIWSSSGNFRARKADATTAGKQADGFVRDAVTSGQPATVYFEGPNTGLSGLSPGVQYLSTTAGLATATPPSSAGNIVQTVGIAYEATALNFDRGVPVTLA